MDAFKDKVHEIEEGAKKQFDNLFHSMSFFLLYRKYIKLTEYQTKNPTRRVRAHPSSRLPLRLRLRLRLRPRPHPHHHHHHTYKYTRSQTQDPKSTVENKPRSKLKHRQTHTPQSRSSPAGSSSMYAGRDESPDYAVGFIRLNFFFSIFNLIRILTYIPDMNEQAKQKTEDAKKSATDQAKNLAGRE